MILLLGSSGYIGSAFAIELRKRGARFRALSRPEADYTRFPILRQVLNELRPELLINCAGYTGKPNVDACETAQTETLMGNVLFPLTVAQACEVTNVPCAHISSGCIYSGARIVRNGTIRTARDFNDPEVQWLLENERSALQGFREDDEPNFSFRQPPCSYYSGTKALAEEAIADFPNHFIVRLRIPFDEFDNTRNYLSKLQRYPRIYNSVNSLSHRGDFARAALELWERRVPYGTYNIVNPGFVTTKDVVESLQTILKLNKPFSYFANDEEFYTVAAKTPRANCILDTSKILATGIDIRPVEEALVDALLKWKPESHGLCNTTTARENAEMPLPLLV